MAQQFVDVMAASLAAVDNNQQDPIEYERLSWSGDMKQSEIFSSWDDNEEITDARGQVESGLGHPILSPLGEKN
ncbi:hypothetical protein AAU57_02075 [Nonlabens sp. YIK11]|uniref:hypothetical protein n=1 Tax=Nonlabens sp. YIK11 TaxID=1453349 RepID=UPI0006DCA1B0|nr:hypothetical protein [Nonlabens sp. YIK11]KQC32245.1 hypothetical protein AAU57_02075 [Nonlabens sp. YIK11]